MKKNYISPKLMIDEIQMVNCLCLSRNDDIADNSAVLSKEVEDPFDLDFNF